MVGVGRLRPFFHTPHAHADAEVQIRAAKPREKAYKLFGERGFLLITPGADSYRGRLWRLRYRYAKVEKLLSLGNYPDISLKRAREKRDEARRLLADGIDPSARINAVREQPTRLVPFLASALQRYVGVVTQGEQLLDLGIPIPEPP